MVFRPLPSQQILKQTFRYDPATGELSWRERACNTVRADRKAGSAHSSGYLTVCVGYVSYLVHRVIWKLVTGEDPEFIDHIDGDKRNNRWSNLRCVSKSQNARNAKRPSTNKSGVIGVCFAPRRGKWIAQLHIKAGITKHIRRECATFDEAVEIRRGLEVEYEFHPNHGRASPADEVRDRNEVRDSLNHGA